MNGNPLNTFLTKYSKSIEEQYSEKKLPQNFALKKKSTPASNVSTEWYMNACVTSTKDWEWTQSPCTMGPKLIWIRIQFFYYLKCHMNLVKLGRGHRREIDNKEKKL